MKREVWVEIDAEEYRKCSYDYRQVITTANQGMMHLKKVCLHESHWIPVSERMPDKPEHYLVVRLDRLDWCYCELNEEFNCKPHTAFTSKGVTHWLEAPPVPVETEPSDFERWLWDYMVKTNTNHVSHELRSHMKSAWNAAKGL